ncbi:hypothetical protein [Flavobacterium magnum]|uniref:hypothetical protein n=1 Tax=Flavobacterium magnum TaxID=2162713 RepID=UPI0011B28449|nr:hypothetical protein [Flavobacterium magnum]
MDNFSLAEIVIIVIIAIAAFVFLREVTTWYFKIEKRIELQNETNRLLNILVERSSPETTNQDYFETNPNGEETDVNNPGELQKIISDLNKKSI